MYQAKLIRQSWPWYNQLMKILGIDPGTGRTGWSVVEIDKSVEKLLACGCVQTAVHTPLPERLETIFHQLEQVIDQFQPDQAAVEELFFATNAKTAMSVSQARGVILLALQLGKIPIFNYTPLQVKSAITGYGQADKKQVERMVLAILRLKESPKPDDVVDAIAIALTHGANTYKRLKP